MRESLKFPKSEVAEVYSQPTTNPKTEYKA
jgi:hypothetical protein